jgi:hypothetical protein
MRNKVAVVGLLPADDKYSFHMAQPSESSSHNVLASMHRGRATGGAAAHVMVLRAAAGAGWLLDHCPA